MTATRWKPTQEAIALNLAVCDRLHAVLGIHAKLRRGEPVTDSDRRTVAGLIRALVAEWV